MAVLYDDEMMKQVLEIADVVEREGVANFTCCESVRHHTGHFCGLDVSKANGKVFHVKACDLEIEIKSVALANDNSLSSNGALAIHFVTGTPAILAQWHQTVTSFGFQARM